MTTMADVGKKSFSSIFSENTENTNQKIRDAISVFGLSKYVKFETLEKNYRTLKENHSPLPIVIGDKENKCLVVDVHGKGDCALLALLGPLLGYIPDKDDKGKEVYTLRHKMAELVENDPNKFVNIFGSIEGVQQWARDVKRERHWEGSDMFHVFSKITNICVHTVNTTDYVVRGLIEKVTHYLPHSNINDWNTSLALRFVDNCHFQTLVPVALPGSISVKVLNPSETEMPTVDVQEEPDLNNRHEKWQTARSRKKERFPKVSSQREKKAKTSAGGGKASASEGKSSSSDRKASESGDWSFLMKPKKSKSKEEQDKTPEKTEDEENIKKSKKEKKTKAKNKSKIEEEEAESPVKPKSVKKSSKKSEEPENKDVIEDMEVEEPKQEFIDSPVKPKKRRMRLLTSSDSEDSDLDTSSTSKETNKIEGDSGPETAKNAGKTEHVDEVTKGGRINEESNEEVESNSDKTETLSEEETSSKKSPMKKESTRMKTPVIENSKGMLKGRGQGKRRLGTVRVRPQVIHWSNTWLDLVDINGDTVGEYGRYVDTETGKCIWCNAVVKFNTMGRHSFLQHATGKKHKNVADGRKERVPSQPVIQPVIDAADTADEENNQNNLDQHNNEYVEAPAGRGAFQQSGRGGKQPAALGRGSMPLVARRSSNQWAVGDQVVKAEILMVLKSAESNWSFKSMDNVAEVLRKMAPDNLILSKFTLMRHKASYVLTYGLFPYFKRKLIDALKKSPAFTVSTDSATFKQGQTGLSKHVDYDVRFFDENRKRVSDNFLDYSSLGREPASIQVEKLMGCFRSCGINVTKIICLSRDNPNVMQAVFKLLDRELAALNNPGLVDAPCLLHPTHNAFKAACKALAKNTNGDRVDSEDEDSVDEDSSKLTKLDVIALLGYLFYWFKMSTARREDMMGVRGDLEAEQEDFEESLDQFYKRHIDTRWLEAEPCLERLLSLWQSTVEYFMNFLPRSTDPNNKKAVKSKLYKKIAAHLCDTQVHQTKAKIKFLIFLAKKTKYFLKKFQTERPQIHHLYKDSIGMFEEISALVVEKDFMAKVPPTGYPDLDFTDDDNLRNFARCGYIPDVKTEFDQIASSLARRELYLGMREAVRAMLIHLQKHLPFRNILLKEMGFLDPKYRLTRKNVPQAGVKVARLLNRFTESEITQLNIELTRYHSLSYEIIPMMGSKDKDPIDDWWMKTLDVMEAETGESPDTLAKLVKMCMVISHGQAIVERGFSSTKDFVDGRNSLVDQTVKALKMTKQAITKAGGAQNVEITSSMIQEVKASHQTFKQQERREKEQEERSKAQQEEADRIAEKRKRKEEETKGWEEKKKELEAQMRAGQEIINVENDNVARITNESLNKKAGLEEMRAHMATVQFCQRNISKEQAKLTLLNQEYAAHIGKKPRN